MNSGHSLSRLTLSGLVCAVLLAMPGARWFTNLAGADQERLVAERLAKMEAMALAEVVTLEVEAHGYEGEPGLVALSRFWQETEPGVDAGPCPVTCTVTVPPTCGLLCSGGLNGDGLSARKPASASILIRFDRICS